MCFTLNIENKIDSTHLMWSEDTAIYLIQNKLR